MSQLPPKFFENNSEVQFAVADIEQYINDSAKLAFPMIEWKAIATYDSNDTSLAAVVESADGIFYNLIFSKGDSNPLLQRFVDDDTATFAESNVRIAVDLDDYPDLLELIDETYTDGMDEILEAWVVGNELEIVARDENKQFLVLINGQTVELVQTDEELTSSVANFASPKKRNCSVGWTCGGTCITKAKKCRKNATEAQSYKAAEIIDNAKQGKKSVLGVPSTASLLDHKKALIKIKAETKGVGRRYMNAQLEYNKKAAESNSK